MKKLFSILAMCLVSLGMMAQTSTMATLTHDATTTEYYGVDAFASAVSAAVDGDLITLSHGQFNGTTINKSLNIRGAGTTSSEETSTIISNVTIDKSSDPNEENHWLNIEGINFDCTINFRKPKNKDELYIIKDLCFKKCTIRETGYPDYYNNDYYRSTLKDCSLINCKVRGSFSVTNESSVSFINSIVYNFAYQTDARTANTKVNFLNSIVICPGGGNPSNCPVLNAENSIIMVNKPSTSREDFFNSRISLNSCFVIGQNLCYGGDTNPLRNCECTNNTTWNAMTVTDMFESLTTYSNIDLTNDYKLTEAAKAILGTDGTERGIYGGVAPYSAIVSYPRFTTFDVAKKAEEGKLAVSVSTTE